MTGMLKENRALNIEDANTIFPLENTIMLRVTTEKTVNLANSIKVTYTSGSTGEPKGVCLSAQNIGAVCEGIDVSMNSMAPTNHLCVLPLATLLENIAGVYVCLIHGGVVITEPLAALGFLSNAEFDISKLLEKIELYQVGSIILLPQMLTLLVHGFNDTVLKQCASLQFIAVGGGKSSALILQQADALDLPVFEGYGLSECASVVSLNLPFQDKVGSVGKALPHVSVVISDDGEIVIEGQAMLGYLNELGELEQPLARIFTGDLGYIDEEGYIFVSGRKKNTIVSSFGRNISPEWVEASLSSSAVISQVAVFGEARPSLSAVIVSSTTNTEAINNAIEACNKQLPDYAQIRHWVTAEQPFTPNNNLLTNNGRLKRLAIETFYKQQLDAPYL
jgi:long-subunit acyl-CoA synthetase (AMP-forming)